MGSIGGSQRVTIASNVGTPTAQLCKKAYIIPATGNSGIIRLRIDSVCTDSTGIPIAKASAYANNIFSVEVENLNQLNFYGSNDSDVVDILWVY